MKENCIKEYHQFEENDIIQVHLSRIDLWERESINKIKKTAEIARNDLLDIFNRMKNQLKLSLNKINDEIQLNLERKNDTEINSNQWMKQLKQLRQILETSLTDDMIENAQSSIRLLKIIDKKQLVTTDTSPREKFHKIVGAIILSEDYRTATCSGSYWNGSNISGNNHYSYGIHSIRFRINKKGKNNLFFGIQTSAKDTNPYNRKTPFAYGWWKIPPNNDEEEKNIKDPTIRTGDEVTLTLDCSNSQIQFEHHRTNRFAYEPISSEQCPFPWKIALVLYSPGDSVSILS